MEQIIISENLRSIPIQEVGIYQINEMRMKIMIGIISDGMPIPFQMISERNMVHQAHLTIMELTEFETYMVGIQMIRRFQAIYF